MSNFSNRKRKCVLPMVYLLLLVLLKRVAVVSKSILFTSVQEYLALEKFDILKESFKELLIL